MIIIEQSQEAETYNLLLKEDSIFAISLLKTQETVPFDSEVKNNEVTTFEIYKNGEIVDDFYINLLVNKILVEKVKLSLKVRIYFFDSLNDKNVLLGLKAVLVFAGLINENDFLVDWEDYKRLIWLGEVIYERKTF